MPSTWNIAQQTLPARGCLQPLCSAGSTAPPQSEDTAAVVREGNRKDGRPLSPRLSVVWYGGSDPDKIRSHLLHSAVEWFPPLEDEKACFELWGSWG